MTNAAIGTIYPVFTESGRCLTEMYTGFDYTIHMVKREKRNGPVISNQPKARPDRAKHVKVTTRQPKWGINSMPEHQPVRRLTSADLKPQGLITW